MGHYSADREYEHQQLRMAANNERRELLEQARVLQKLYRAKMPVRFTESLEDYINYLTVLIQREELSLAEKI